MGWRALVWVGATVAAVAAASCSEDGSNGDGGSAGSGASAGTGGQGLTAGSGGTATGTGTAVGGAGGGGGTLECWEFSNNPSEPLAVDDTFVATSPTWQRPHDDPPVCPATALLPPTAAEVPFVAYAFCNNDTVPHVYDFEMLAQDGPSGETPLDDPYMFLYQGIGIPSDPLQCLAVNDDIEGALNTKDSEILGVTVPAGGAITVVGTTFTFDPNDGTGQGYHIVVVSNADP
ncbi:MAG: hypothetical protein JRI23_22315 [Deltaproteobacteria bacterium]|jgi:hypothetical protein|nr:hypothetical protein [Deltaproteobacteria bacterium]MBW2534681.1 hypothetical protein [Deltaproteobacteria bacterium]